MGIGSSPRLIIASSWYAYMYTHTNMQISVCIKYSDRYIHTLTHVYIYIHIYIYLYTHICVYIYVYTQYTHDICVVSAVAAFAPLLCGELEQKYKIFRSTLVPFSSRGAMLVPQDLTTLVAFHTGLHFPI